MKLIDSSGWLQYFMNGPLIEPFAMHLNKPHEIVTPTVVLYEVYKTLKRELGEEQALETVSQMEETRLVPLTPRIAYLAADVSLEHRLPMADSIVYATAQVEGAKLVTSDADFKDLPGVLYLVSPDH